MDEAAPVRFGLVGYGFGGRYFHAPLIASADECDLVGVVTSSPERQALVAQEHPRVAVHASLTTLRDAGVEAVAISTPADTHTDLTLEALRLGMAVVCDKPFALDVGSARAAVELAEELGLPLSPYQNRRWDSDFLTVRSLAGDGSLGTAGTFVLSDGDTQEDALVAGETPRSLGDKWGMEPRAPVGHLFTGSTRRDVPAVAGAWSSFYPSFANAVRGTGSVPVAPRDAIATAAVLEAAAGSARTGAVVAVGAP